VAEVRAAHAERTIELDVQGDCVGAWDADRLAQLCSNLLSNAIEHGDAVAPVRLRLDGRASDSVELLVSNTGKPIPPEALPELFLAFRRAPGHGRGRGGVGLGLYIVDQIVRGHGGSMEAQSDETATRFTVRLPRAPI
jgi:signal transduction histidine kinase